MDGVDGRARDSEDIKGIVKPYDWTYTTPYRGTFNQPVQPEFNYTKCSSRPQHWSCR